MRCGCAGWRSNASPDHGIAAPARRSLAILGARGRLDHLELLAGGDVVGLVGQHVDDRAAGALIGLVHQLLELLLAARPVLSLPGKLLAGGVLILSGIG